MKSFIAFIFVCTSLSSFASTTCSKGTRTILSCLSQDGAQFDVCKKLNSYQIRVNGEVYALDSQKLTADGITSFQGVNYSGDRFILEQRDSSKATLTEVNKFEMPIGEELELSCN